MAFRTALTADADCGNAIANGGAPAADGCNMVCNGNTTEMCGGPNRLNVYSLGASQTTAATTAATTAPGTTTGTATTGTTTALPTTTPAGPGQPASVGPYNWYGCMSEATGMRALSLKANAADGMTLESCQAFCAGYTYFGTEYGRECYCGNSFNAGSVLRPQAECKMLCMGNNLEICGEGNRLSVYKLDGVAATTATTAPATTTAGPAPTGFPAGWTSQGCWIDGAQGRILPVQLPDDPQLTQQSCAQSCFAQGYSISATEYHTQCFCGNAIINSGVRTPDTASCSTPCGGNGAEMCGGPNRMTIFSNGEPVVYGPPTAQTGGLPGQWKYAGCYEDNIDNKRTLYWQLFFPGTMTAKLCLDRCAKFGYAAAGLEYGEECYCGDPQNLNTAGALNNLVLAKRPEAECNVLCAGNSSSICGGGGRLSTYFWTGGEPLYDWKFGTTPATAGAYTFLIGGVCIPLMTMETITGKITFLEKWGTGPPNSTGAYELDLTQINDFSKAWRPMHVKTDIFCSAGLVLPDRQGRQLTIGGWSGESTEGVRLYVPDGSAGVFGQNDWQENVNELRLQDGRWYPSALVMANGSIMVIGGEEGSNAAAVPTIEVLPNTGTAPLYMDWLDRTNPNNLYPFVCVLPHGGIFVAYWNEARVLNEDTFATTRTLPNIPGAVNDDLGGRTYPLEGTAVLLPQVYPYTAAFEVLMCGGSTIGPAWALDNCASIEAETPGAQWVIERMPSRRVMTCMSPLPDGTYLINNGAQHGVAGFGLATEPNLNALIYDPFKPRHHRITIAANTTVARMYHSESITLLDGRVLVSGSDPEDGKNPQEYRVEVYSPPYLLNGLTRPVLVELAEKDWTYGTQYTFKIDHAARYAPIKVTLLGAVSSTHGNSMGARTLMPLVTCADDGGKTCKVTAPPNAHVAPPGWYQFFVLDGTQPAVGVYVRIGGDPAGLGNWPPGPNFLKPGVGHI
jgi:hypothetical protein